MVDDGCNVLRGVASITIPSCIELGTLLGGSVITETIFAWPGGGRLSVQAIFNRDYPVVQAAVFLLASTFVFPELHRGRGIHLARSAHPVPLMAPPNGVSTVVLPLPSAPEERQWVMTLKRLARRRTALFGLAVVAVVILSAVGAPLVTVFDPSSRTSTSA